MYSLHSHIHPHILHDKWESIPSPRTETMQIIEKNPNFMIKGINAISGTMQLAGNIGIAYETWNTIERAKLSKNPEVIDTLKLLMATGVISSKIDILSLLARWGEGSGEKGAQKIIEALKNAEEKGEVQIVTYNNGNYTSESLKKYEDSVNKNTNTMNVSAMKGLYSLRGSGSGFSETTWSKIGLYVYSYNASGKGADSRLVKELDAKSVSDLKILGEKMKSREAIKLDIIAKNILGKIQTDRPDIANLLRNTDLQMKPDGKTIDVSAIIASFEKDGNNLTIKQIEEKFSELAKTIKQNGEALIKESKNILNGIPGAPKTLREIGIKSIPSLRLGKQVDLSNELIANVNPEEAGAMMIAIDMYQRKLDPKSGDYSTIIQKIELIKLSLQLSREGKNIQGRAGQLQITANHTREQRLSGGTRATYTLPDERVLRVANNIAISTAQEESTRTDLKEYGINTPEQAESKLRELETRTGQLTPDEKNLEKLLKQYIRDAHDVARQYQLARETLGEKTAQKIFTQTDQFISGNPNKTYDFKDLEKIAKLMDSELTSGNKALIHMQPGEILPMQKLMEGNMQTSLMNAPEISKIQLIMNTDGTYEIPLFDEKHLTQDEVQEYITDIALYADLGLSQFIPHLKLITSELRTKGINTAIDDSHSTMEQQQVLKAIYKLLFKEEIQPTTNLEDVKGAFRTKMGPNSTNMKSTMQMTLQGQGLIASPGGAISADTLKNWIGGNLDYSSPNINPTATT